MVRGRQGQFVQQRRPRMWCPAPWCSRFGQNHVRNIIKSCHLILSPGQARWKCPCQEGCLQEAWTGKSHSALQEAPSHLPIIRSTSSAPSRTRRSAATPTWRTRWTRWGRSRLRRSSKLQGWPFTSFRCLEHSTDMFLLGMFSRLPPPWREKTKKETKANSPETTKNLLSNAQPNTSNTVINSCYLLFSIYFLSTCYRQCINLSYRSMPLLFSCPTVIVIIVIFIFRKQKFV